MSDSPTSNGLATPHVPGQYTGKCLSCQRLMEWADKRCRICIDCYKEPERPPSNVLDHLDKLFSGDTEMCEVRASEWRAVKAHISSLERATAYAKAERDRWYGKAIRRVEPGVPDEPKAPTPADEVEMNRIFDAWFDSLREPPQNYLKVFAAGYAAAMLRRYQPPADAQFICPHGKDVRHIECGQCNAPPPTGLHAQISAFASTLATDRTYRGDIVEDLRAILDRHAMPPMERPWKIGDCVEWNTLKGVLQEEPTVLIWWQDGVKCRIPINSLKRRDCDCNDRSPLTKGAATPEKPACACGHPAWMHETPGTECAEEDCRCTSYRCPDEKTATGMTSKDNLDMQEAVRTLSAHETNAIPEPPEATWLCSCGRSNYVTSLYCTFCERRRRPHGSL